MIPEIFEHVGRTVTQWRFWVGILLTTPASAAVASRYGQGWGFVVFMLTCLGFDFIFQANRRVQAGQQ